MPDKTKPRIIYFWPDSGDEDANCGLWWPEPTLEDAPEAGPGTPAIVVPDDMTLDGARAGLWPGDTWERTEIARYQVVEACKLYPACVLRLLYENLKPEGVPDGE
jgi:hypothetical protein